MDTKLPAAFWSDPKFDKCSTDLLLAVLWIMSNDRRNLAGYADVSPRTFTFQTHLPFAIFERACKALGKGLVREGNRYWLRYFIREQIGAGESLARNNMLKPLLRALSLVDSPSIHSEILNEYPELSESDATSPAQGHAKPKSREEQSREEQNGAEQSKGGLGESLPSPRRGSRLGSSRPADHPEPMRVRMVALGEIVNRRPDSAWSEAEKKALTAAGLVELEEADFNEQVDAMRSFYRAAIPEAKKYQFFRRTTLPTLLNNWPSELDKARTWRGVAGGEGDGVRKV